MKNNMEIPGIINKKSCGISKVLSFQGFPESLVFAGISWSKVKKPKNSKGEGVDSKTQVLNPSPPGMNAVQIFYNHFKVFQHILAFWNQNAKCWKALTEDETLNSYDVTCDVTFI